MAAKYTFRIRKSKRLVCLYYQDRLIAKPTKKEWEKAKRRAE